MTPDHRILVGEKWKEARFVQDHKELRRALLPAPKSPSSKASSGRVPDVRSCRYSFTSECSSLESIGTSILQRMLSRFSSRNVQKSDIPNLETYGSKNYRFSIFWIQKLWSKRHPVLQQMDVFFQFLFGYGRFLPRRFNSGEDRQQWSLLPGELPVGLQSRAAKEQEEQSLGENGKRMYSLSRVLPEKRSEPRSHNPLSGRNQRRWRRSPSFVPDVNVPTGEEVEVYDLVNCGPRNRFMVKTSSGNALIVHNSAAHGLNLHVGGASQACWFSLPESQELWEQGNRRLARKGQKKQAISHVLFAVNTKEQQVADALKSHGQLQDLLMETVHAQDQHS